DEVDEEQAYLEGEGDRSLAYWRDVHWNFFSRECAQIGREPSEHMPVLCERFKLVFP
ncbi:MAG: ASCH domain-containing protein, partial [Anaerolineales bacterium]